MATEKRYTLEDLAKLSPEQLEEIGELDGNAFDVSGEDDGQGLGMSEEVSDPGDQGGEQDVTGATAGATESQGDEDEPTEIYVQTKSGKGRIPYSELKNTRDELGKTREKLTQLEQQLEDLKKTSQQKAKAPAPVVDIDFEAPADLQEQITKATARLSEIKRQYEAGDLDWDGYQEALDETVNKQGELSRIAAKAELAAEMRAKAAKQAEQEAEALWSDSVSAFLEKSHDGIDYQTDQAKADDLDRYVRLLGADPSNEDKSHEWFLTTAHAAVLAKHGMSKAPAQDPPPAQAGEGEGKGKAQPAQKVQQPKAPINTLSDIPGGTPPAKDEMEQLDDAGVAALTQRLMRDPGALDDYLSRL